MSSELTIFFILLEQMVPTTGSLFPSGSKLLQTRIISRRLRKLLVSKQDQSLSRTIYLVSYLAMRISSKRRVSKKVSDLVSAELCQISVRMKQLTFFFSDNALDINVFLYHYITTTFAYGAQQFGPHRRHERRQQSSCN